MCDIRVENSSWEKCMENSTICVHVQGTWSAFWCNASSPASIKTTHFARLTVIGFITQMFHCKGAVECDRFRTLHCKIQYADKVQIPLKSGSGEGLTLETSASLSLNGSDFYCYRLVWHQIFMLHFSTLSWETNLTFTYQMVCVIK